jgi:hypothetical protein
MKRLVKIMRGHAVSHRRLLNEDWSQTTHEKLLVGLALNKIER